MSTIVKTPSAADFLALVPHLAGFQPKNSLVLVAFIGNRTRGAIRFDLPVAESTRFHRKFATTIIGMLSKLEAVDGVVPVIYCDEPFGASAPHPAFMRVVTERAEFSGFRVKDALCVAGDGWGSYLAPECPPGGRDLDEIVSSDIHQRLSEESRGPVGDVLDGASLPEVELATRERVGRLVARIGDAPSEDDSPLLRFIRELYIDIPEFLEGMIEEGPEQLTDWMAAVAILFVGAPTSRDVAMFQWAFDISVGESTIDFNHRYAAGVEPADADGLNRMIGGGSRPDPERLERAIELVAAIAARAPRSHRPPLLTMLGWFYWALGRSSVASVFVRMALEIDGAYGLAEILTTMLNAGMLPDWAFGDDEERARRWSVDDLSVPSEVNDRPEVIGPPEARDSE